MLSIEKPPPAPLLTDLPCNTSNNNINNNNTDDDHDHDKVSQKTNNLELDHNLPNFSIRDYVFAARSKDIENNWPFSLKNLQVCQNHGVKDALPPFEPVDAVRKQCSKRHRLETFSIEKQNIASFDKEPSGKANHAVAQEPPCDGKVNNDKLAVSCVDISSCRSGQENEFVSTTTSVSQFELDSVPDNMQSSSQITETETLLKTSAKVGAAAAPPQVNNKTGNNSRPSGKKCRLIVKFGGNSDHSSNEDIANNCPTVSEAMASKVCPVCKIFSSSSNTTLNAHIDQCLATESMPSDFKPTRYRTKPRKYRFIVDIYTTAKSCTLAELDRRNGTTWSVVSTLPSQESGKIETSREDKKRMLSVNHPVDVDDVGPVYFDANGTKLRILSKFNNHPQESEVREDTGEMGESKGAKVNNHILKKKKKRLVQKHLSSLSHKPRNSQISGDVEGNNREEKRPEKVHQMTKQMKPSDSGTLRQWVCSKKRGITKKVSGHGEHKPLKCRWNFPQDLLVDHNHQSFSEAPAERNISQKKLNVSEMLVRKEQAREKMVSSSGGKRATCSTVKGICDNMKASFLPMKRNSNQLNKDGTSIQDSWMLKSPASTRSHTFSVNKKSDQSIHDTEVSTVAPKSLRSSQATVTKAKSSSCYKKGMPSRNQLPFVSESVVGKTKKLSAFNKCQVQSMRKRDNELIACQSKVDRRYALDTDSESQYESEETADVSFEGDSSLETRQDRAMKHILQTEEGWSLQNSKSTVHDSHPNVVVNAVDLSVDGHSCEGETAKKQVGQHAEDMVSELSSKTSDELLCGTEVPTNMAGTDFVDDQHLFQMDVGDGMIGQNGDMGVELDSEAALGSSFPEVDPIPIPGPPGSFLPSPRDMCSEDFHGNSSLTTSRVQSSPDQQEIADADPSDSPISAASTISNSIAAGSNSNHKQSQPSSSMSPSTLQTNLLPGFTAATTDTSVQQGCGAQLPLSKGTEVERSVFDTGVVKLDKISMEKGSLNFKNDQPCCCQRKSAALNNQESQLLRRRKMALLTVPPTGKQTGGNSQPRSTNLDSRFELVPPSTIPTSVSDNVAVPVIKPSTGSIPLKESSISGVRVVARADSDSASPSASNPVLRLMGKNLMVVNKDGDASTPMGLVQTHAKNDHQASSLPTFPNRSNTKIMNQDFHNNLNQDSLVFGHDPRNTASPYFDPRFTQNFRSHSDSVFPQGPNQRSTVGFRDQQTDGGFARPMKLLNFKSDSTVSSRQNSLKNTVNTLGSFRMGNGVEPPDRLCKHADLSINSAKEIIVIDDVPQGKPTVIGEATRHSEVWTFTSSTATTSMNCKPGSVHAFYQSQELVRESVPCSSGIPVTPNNRLLDISSKGWGCTSDGPKMVPQSPFVAASSSNGLLRPTPALYHSPGFL